MAVGWKNGVPGGKPNAVGANGIYISKKKHIKMMIQIIIE